MGACMHACIQTYIHAYLLIPIDPNVYLYECTHVRMYVSMYSFSSHVFMPVCIYIYMYMYVFICICI